MRVSESGELILPGALVEQLGMRPGDPIDATFEGGRIVLAPLPLAAAAPASLLIRLQAGPF
jgi:bifunctional DNA-binding transcriptional regulator/antitoxin component of YhaV-PrlF toxin-antitoxin module